MLNIITWGMKHELKMHFSGEILVIYVAKLFLVSMILYTYRHLFFKKLNIIYTSYYVLFTLYF